MAYQMMEEIGNMKKIKQENNKLIDDDIIECKHPIFTGFIIAILLGTGFILYECHIMLAIPYTILMIFFLYRILKNQMNNNMKNKECKLDNIMVTVGEDMSHKYAWCIRKVNDVKCLCIHEPNDDRCCMFNEQDFITAIPIEQIEDALKLYRL